MAIIIALLITISMLVGLMLLGIYATYKLNRFQRREDL